MGLARPWQMSPQLVQAGKLKLNFEPCVVVLIIPFINVTYTVTLPLSIYWDN